MSTMDLQTLADHLEKGGTTPTEVISFAIKMGYLTESARGRNKSGAWHHPGDKNSRLWIMPPLNWENHRFWLIPNENLHILSELNRVQSLNDSSFCWELSTKIFIDFQVSLVKSEFQL